MSEFKINLPVQATQATSTNPRKLFLFAHTKTGKTTLASMLPNNLIIDFENGSNFINGMKLNVIEESKKNGITPLEYLKNLTNALKVSSYKYDYITLDTATAMEEMASQLATEIYKNSPQGKTFRGTNVVAELPNGAGYQWFRLAFEKIYESFQDIPLKCLIILGHVKSSSINKDGKDLEVRDVNLTGKMKLIISADMDAIGFLYRSANDPNKLMVSFKTSELDLATGTRAEHLRQQEFPILEYDHASNKFTAHWDKIFIGNK